MISSRLLLIVLLTSACTGPVYWKPTGGFNQHAEFKQANDWCFYYSYFHTACMEERGFIVLPEAHQQAWRGAAMRVARNELSAKEGIVLFNEQTGWIYKNDNELAPTVDWEREMRRISK